MYKCRDCKEYFDTPKAYEDKVEFWGSITSMYSYCCPYCESEDFDDAYEVEREEEELEEEEYEEIMSNAILN